MGGGQSLQVKNSLRAVNDRYEDSDDVPPPVRVIVAEGDEDVTIKVFFCPMSSLVSLHMPMRGKLCQSASGCG